MIRLTTQKEIVVGSACQYCEFSGLSTDTKPTDNYIATGSLFLEVDTGDVYAYDEEEPEWNKICELGGGS